MDCSGIEVRYFMTDHLGSVRCVANERAVLLEENDYYPFGEAHSNPLLTHTDNRYRYNGKEEQVLLPSLILDYGARHYDPREGMWFTPDPLAEKYYSISPYVFCVNNPLKYVDFDGRDRKLVYDNENKIITVQATYYHDINNGSYANAGVSVFNNMKGLSYTAGDGTTYQVVFDLKTKRASNPKSTANADPSGNYVELSPDFGTSEDGSKILGRGGGKMVSLLSETKDDDFVTAHEIGHTLGAALRNPDGSDNHAPEGLMVKTVDHPKKSKQLDQKSVNEIIERGRGPVEEKSPTIWERIQNWLSK